MFSFKSISQGFNHETKQHVMYNICNKKGISAFKAHLDFNCTCKARKVVSQSLHLKWLVSIPKRCGNHHEHRLVNARINGCKTTVTKKELHLYFKHQLEYCIPEVMLSVNQFHTEVSLTVDEHRTTQDKKLPCLLKKGSPQNTQNQGFVIT